MSRCSMKFPTTFDEVISVLRNSHPEHGLQCAEELLKERPSDVELHIAGLFHDVAHRVEGSVEATHGIVGERILRPLFGDRVGALVRLHVPAKRYLVTADPSYNEVLSPESVETLRMQGGAMTTQERTRFLTEEHAVSALMLRLADDRAKVPGRVTLPLDHWEPIARSFHEKVVSSLALR